MSDTFYRDLLDWWMVSDPWPLILGLDHHQRVTVVLDEEARKRGFDGAVDAYHRFQPAEEKA